MIQLGISDIKSGWIRKIFGGWGEKVFTLKAGHLPNLPFSKSQTRLLRKGMPKGKCANSKESIGVVYDSEMEF